MQVSRPSSAVLIAVFLFLSLSGTLVVLHPHLASSTTSHAGTAAGKASLRVGVSFLLVGDEAVLPALTLSESLGSTLTYPADRVCVCVGLSDGALAVMERAGWRTVVRSAVSWPDAPGGEPHEGEKVRSAPSRIATYNKIHLWGLVEYDVLLQLDIDMVVTGDVAYAFDRVAEFHADQSTKLRVCIQPPKREFWNYYFNAGFMLVKPSRETHAGLLRALSEHDFQEDPSESLRTEQDLLFSYFRREQLDQFETGPNTCTDVYGFPGSLVVKASRAVLRRRGAKVIHFAGHCKPWLLTMYTGFEEIANKKCTTATKCVEWAGTYTVWLWQYHYASMLWHAREAVADEEVAAERADMMETLEHLIVTLHSLRPLCS